MLRVSTRVLTVYSLRYTSVLNVSDTVTISVITLPLAMFHLLENLQFATDRNCKAHQEAKQQSNRQIQRKREIARETG